MRDCAKVGEYAHLGIGAIAWPGTESGADSMVRAGATTCRLELPGGHR